MRLFVCEGINGVLFSRISSMVEGWQKPYSKQQVEQLWTIAQVIKYYCTQFSSRRSIAKWTMATQIFADSMSAACRQWKVRVASRGLSVAGVKLFEKGVCTDCATVYAEPRRGFRV